MRYFLGLLWLLALPASAQVYKYLDAYGTIHYSDTPRDSAGSEAITLAPLNRQPALPNALPDNPQQLLPEQEPTHAVYSVLSISGLPADQALRANNGSFRVHATLTPSLHSQHSLQWFLDDQPYGPASAETALQLNNVDRGEHRLSFKVMAGHHTLQQSPTVSFYLQRSRLH